MTVSVEIPQYRSHKTVRAAKITGFRPNGIADAPDLLLGEIGGVVTLLPEWHAKHAPQVGGYYVVYEDGYTSYSPAKAFEEGYTALPATFKDRVRAEAAELDERIAKLAAFLPTDTCQALPADEHDRLTAQLAAMQDYSGCLSERIAAF